MNQTNKTLQILIIPNDFCDNLTDYFNRYIEKSIGAISFILNMLCVLVFLKITRFQKEEIYKYLLFKSIIDSYISLRITLKSVFNCQDCELEKSFGIKIFYLVFIIYLDYAAEIISIVCELVANFNRYRFLTKSFQFLEKLSYKMTIFLMTLYALLFCIYLLFDNKITSKQKLNGTITVYSIKDNNFGSAGLAWGYAHTITRNFIFVAAILIVNIMTLRSVKGILRKKDIMLNHHELGKKSKIVKHNEKAELKLTLMVMATSGVIFVACGMNFIKWLKVFVFTTNKCYITVTYIIYWLSFSLYFFIYFYFNQSFKKFLFYMFKTKKNIKEILMSHK